MSAKADKKGRQAEELGALFLEHQILPPDASFK